MSKFDDEIHILKESLRLLGDDVPTSLLDRGWAPKTLDVADDEPIEWFWPPTAPVGYGGLPEWSAPAMQNRPHLFGRRHTPWLKPTRITQTDHGWLLEYGEAIAQAPDVPVEYTHNAALLADLQRIEWWPMSIEEAKQLQAERLLETTRATAYNEHSLGFLMITEPYCTRIREVSKARKWGGDERALADLINAEMYASAVRSARAGGEGWGLSGPIDSEN